MSNILLKGMRITLSICKCVYCGSTIEDGDLYISKRRDNTRVYYCITCAEVLNIVLSDDIKNALIKYDVVFTSKKTQNAEIREAQLYLEEVERKNKAKAEVKTKRIELIAIRKLEKEKKRIAIIERRRVQNKIRLDKKEILERWNNIITDFINSNDKMVEVNVGSLTGRYVYGQLKDIIELRNLGDIMSVFRSTNNDKAYLEKREKEREFIAHHDEVKEYNIVYNHVDGIDYPIEFKFTPVDKIDIKKPLSRKEFNEMYRRR